MHSSVTMSGWVGGEIELKATPTGVSIATFRMGCTPRIRRGGDWIDGATTWMTVTCFRVLAENVASSLSKGDAVVVSGYLRTSAWVDDNGEIHERLYLDGKTIGHDLNRGTASFHKSDRPATLTNEDLESEIRLALDSAEQTASAGLAAGSKVA